MRFSVIFMAIMALLFLSQASFGKIITAINPVTTSVLSSPNPSNKHINCIHCILNYLLPGFKRFLTSKFLQSMQRVHLIILPVLFLIAAKPSQKVCKMASYKPMPGGWTKLTGKEIKNNEVRCINHLVSFPAVVLCKIAVFHCAYSF
jgi:hypothetical protein